MTAVKRKKISEDASRLISAMVVYLENPYPGTGEKRKLWDLIIEITGNPAPRCVRCGTINNVRHAADPYAAEINGDDTPVWQCGSCSAESAGDI